MGHEYVGIEEVGLRSPITLSQFVVGSFFASDNTCEIVRPATRRRASIARSSAPAAGPRPADAGAAGRRHPGRHPEVPPADLVRTSWPPDVLGTGWFGAVAADVGPGKTVAGGRRRGGPVRRAGRPALGAERIIAMSRHAARQQLAQFGATDIVIERGDEGVERIKELTGGLGAHSVIEAVGTQEAMMQAIRSTRPGGHVGYVGVSHDVALPGDELFMSHVHLHGGPALVRRFLPDLMDRIWQRKINPARCSTSSSARRRGVGLPRHGHPPEGQGPAAPVNLTYDFTGQVALVTGAGSGMGLATARAFAAANAAVVLADVNATAVRTATDEPSSAGHQALGVECDVSDEDTRRRGGGSGGPDVRQVGHGVQQRGIQIPPCDAADEPAEVFDRVNAINLRGVWACMKHELARCAARAAVPS